MSTTCGIEAARAARSAESEAPAARWIVLLDSASAGRRVARVLLASHAVVAEFDASAPEVLMMTEGLAPSVGAEGAEWDAACAGASPEERARAEVYALAV